MKIIVNSIGFIEEKPKIEKRYSLLMNKLSYCFVVLSLIVITSTLPISSLAIYSKNTEYSYNTNSETQFFSEKKTIHNAKSLNIKNKWTHPLTEKRIYQKLLQAEGKAVISFFTFEERDHSVEFFNKRGIEIKRIYQAIPAIYIKYSIEDVNHFDLSSFRIKYISPLGRYIYSKPQNLETTLDKPVMLSEIREALEIDKLHNMEVNNTKVFGENVTIAVMDSGIESSLKGLRKITEYKGDNNIALTTKDKVIYSFNAVPGEDVNDLSGHGTHIASVLAGNGFFYENNKEQYIQEYGIAPAASLMNIKVLNESGYGKDEWLVDGFDKAIENEAGVQADIITASLTSITFMNIGDPLEELIIEAENRGIIVVTSAGNYGPSGSTVGSPAVWENVISVGSTSNLNDISLFSSLGPSYDLTPGVDIIAPGDSVLGLNHSSGEKRYLSGTSIAAPIVSGALALLKQLHPHLNSTILQTAIIDTANDLNKPIVAQGNGLLDALDAYYWINKYHNIQTFSVIPKRFTPENEFYYSCVEGENSSFNIKTISSEEQILQTQVGGDIEIVKIEKIIQIEKGWNSFLINLQIPDGVPLQNYYCVISLQNDVGFKQNIVIKIQSRYYAGKILFDISHDNDINNNSWFGGSSPYGSHLHLSRILKDRGYIINTYKTGNFSEALNDIDILLISDPELGYKQDELEIIDEFISNGGSFLFLINSYRLKVEGLSEDPIFSSNYTAVNKILDIFGAEIEEGYENTKIPYKADFSSKLSHITDVKNAFFWGSCLRFKNLSSNENNENLAAINLGSETDPIWKIVALTTKYGKGKVLIFGSGYPFTSLGLQKDSYDDDNRNRRKINLDDTRYDYLFSPTYDKYNLELVNDSVRWLSSTYRPKIDVSITPEKILIREEFTITVQITKTSQFSEGNPYASVELFGTVLFKNKSFQHVYLEAIDAGTYQITLRLSSYGWHTLFIPLSLENHRTTDGRIDIFCDVQLWDSRDSLQNIGIFSVLGIFLVIIAIPAFRYRFRKERLLK